MIARFTIKPLLLIGALSLCMFQGVASAQMTTSAPTPTISEAQLNIQLASYFGSNNAAYTSAGGGSLYSQFVDVLESKSDGAHVLNDGTTFWAGHVNQDSRVRAAVIYDANGNIKGAALLHHNCDRFGNAASGSCDQGQTLVLTVISPQSELVNKEMVAKFKAWANRSLKRNAIETGSSLTGLKMVVKVRTLDQT